MEKQKEIFIEIDESGTLEFSKKNKCENFFFLTCSYISSSRGKEANKPFHFKELISNNQITFSKKEKNLVDILTKIEKLNIFYSCLTINMKNLNEENYYQKVNFKIKKYFIELLTKITKNNELKINILYDHGQKRLSNIINDSILEFKNFNPTKDIKYLPKTSNKNLNHGYCDFICSIERIKLKSTLNILSNYEKHLFIENKLLEKILKSLTNKNIDNLEFENFEELILKEEQNKKLLDDDILTPK